MSVPRLAGGLPLLGHGIEFHRNPVNFLRRGRELHGEVFSFNLAGKTVHALTEPQGNSAFFHAPDDQLSAREAYQFTVPMFGKGVVYDVTPELMDEQIRFVLPALRDARMQNYARAFEEETEAYCAGWGDKGEIDLLNAMNELTVFNASRCLVGHEFRQRLSAEFAHSYRDLEAGVNLVAFFKPEWPLPAMRRRDRGRANLARLISGVVAEKRARTPADEDFVDTLVAARYSDGRSLTDHEIVGLLLSLVFAGQHTSAVMASWTGILLLQHPDYLNRVLNEQLKLPHGEPLTIASLRQLVTLERCIKEAERMYPPIVMLIRTILRDFVYQGHTLPAGDLAMVSPAVTHHLPHIFHEPHRYDPDRFAPGREEDRRTQFALIGFGGGKHRCIGSGFAYQQIKVIWTVLLREFDLELSSDEYLPDYSTMMVGPRKPCMVRYRRKPQRLRGSLDVPGDHAMTGDHNGLATSLSQTCDRREKACGAGLQPDQFR
jgi:sterol 14alpha-demethylase